MDYYNETKTLTNEEKQMARFMTEKAPGSVRDTSDF
jgi:hypothetical protein